MSQGKFEMLLIAPANLVGDIVELMDGEGIVVAIKPYDDKKKNGKHYAGGKRNKGISGEAAAIEILKSSSKPMTSIQVGKLMKSKYGFAESSGSPVLSNLSKAKKVACKDRLYSLSK